MVIQMQKRYVGFAFLITILSIFALEAIAQSRGEYIEIVCRASGYRARFPQGSTAEEEMANVQNIIVVCERNNQIRSIKIPLNKDNPVQGEPLLAKQFGYGKSDLLGISLPRFLVPGNTCPLFPISAYLEHNICPIDGTEGIDATIIGHF